jgi:hypothetical protein
MKKQTKNILFTVLLFLLLLFFTPMVSKYSGCIGGGPQFGCVLGTSRRIVFPVYRTIVCLKWHKPSCAPDTFLPGWYNQLLNIENVFVVGLLIFISKYLSSKILLK